MTDDEQAMDETALSLWNAGREIASKCDHYKFQDAGCAGPVRLGYGLCGHPDKARRPAVCRGVSNCPKWPK